MDYGMVVYGELLPIELIGTVYWSYVRSAIICESEVWWVKRGEMGILMRMRKAMVREMCAMALRDKKGVKDLMEKFALNEVSG